MPAGPGRPVDCECHVPALGVSYFQLVTTPLEKRQEEFAAGHIAAANRMECGEDEVSDDEREMYAALAETRRINRLDGRDVAGLIHEIDH